MNRLQDAIKQNCVNIVLNQIGTWRSTGIYIWTIDKYLVYSYGEIPEDIVRSFLKFDWENSVSHVGDINTQDTGFIVRVTEDYIVMGNMERKDYVRYAVTNLVNRLNALSDFYQLRRNGVLKDIREISISMFDENKLIEHMEYSSKQIDFSSNEIKAFFIADRKNRHVYDYLSREEESLNLAKLVETKINEGEQIFRGEMERVPMGFNVGGFNAYYKLTRDKKFFVCLVTALGVTLNRWLDLLVEQVLNPYEELKNPTQLLDSPNAFSFMEAFLKYITTQAESISPQPSPNFLLNTFYTPAFYAPLITNFGTNITNILKRIREMFTEIPQNELDLILEGRLPLIDAIKAHPARWNAYEELCSFLLERGLVFL